MNWLRRSFGLLGCLLGTVGMVACLALCVAIWITRTRVDQVVTEVFDRVETAIVQVDQRSQETIQHIDDTRDAAGHLRENVRSRMVKAAGAKAADALGIDELRQQLATKVQRVKDWTEFIRSTVDLVQQLLGIVDSAAMVNRKSQTREELVATIQSAQQEIERASKLLDDVQEQIDKIREGTDAQQNGARVQGVLVRIDTALDDLQAYVKQFQVNLTIFKAETTELAARMRGWILLAAVILTLLLAWFGIAQFSLAVHGWKLFRVQT